MNSFLFDQYTYLVALVIMELMKLIVTAILFSIETCLFYLFLKMGHSRPLFLYFRLFNTQLTAHKCSILINFCRWLASNRGPLESKATALPTEPQPLPILFYLLRPLQKWVFQASHEPRLHPGFVRLLVHEFTPLTNAILPSYCTNLSMCSFIKRFQSRINLIKDHANKK